MLTELKLRAYGFFGEMKIFKDWQIRKQWRTIMMADPNGEAVESAAFSPAWSIESAARGREVIKHYHEGGGAAGMADLVIPDSFATYGNMTILQFKPGEVDAKLLPSFVPYGITRVEVKEDSVVISRKGIGGAPDQIRLSAASAKRCVETPMEGGGVHFDIEYPLCRKIVIGLDDTDSAAKGATFRTAMEIAVKLGRALKGVEFLRMAISLNWPHNPYKTTNNASTAVVFAVRPRKEEELVSWFEKLARRYTISKDTGMAVINRVRMPEELIAYSRKVKRVEVDVSETYKVAEEVGARLIPITGGDKSRGLIGALSAVGLVDLPGEAIVPVRSDETKQ